MAINPRLHFAINIEQKRENSVNGTRTLEDDAEASFSNLSRDSKASISNGVGTEIRMLMRALGVGRGVDDMRLHLRRHR